MAMRLAMSMLPTAAVSVISKHEPARSICARPQAAADQVEDLRIVE